MVMSAYELEECGSCNPKFPWLLWNIFGIFKDISIDM